MNRILVSLGTVVALGLPPGISSADPIADPTGLLASENVTVHTVLPEQTAIGARFRGTLMYLTTLTGLSIYDVSVPANPVEVGTLPLPHFENEDVDLGGDILLISNDAAESRGILHVVDISDPTAPELLSSHDMGGDPTGLTGGAPGHTASCILDCAFAWVTDSGGIRVIDLRDPTAPRNLGTFRTPAAGDLGVTHDVQTDQDGVAWISGYGGVFGYRIPDDYASRVTAAGAGITDLHASLLYAGTGTAGHSTYG
ncbi:MAG: LVIVD repeat-containing protein, partial [Actinomycetota bacterium]